MVGEAFDTRKRFLGVPKVSFAGWVGTIKHSTMANGVERAQRRHSCCGWMGAIVKVTKIWRTQIKNHARHVHMSFSLQSEDVNKNT